jgi:hypothetical protein
VPSEKEQPIPGTKPRPTATPPTAGSALRTVLHQAGGHVIDPRPSQREAASRERGAPVALGCGKSSRIAAPYGAEGHQLLSARLGVAVQSTLHGDSARSSSSPLVSRGLTNCGPSDHGGVRLTGCGFA